MLNHADEIIRTVIKIINNLENICKISHFFKDNSGIINIKLTVICAKRNRTVYKTHEYHKYLFYWISMVVSGHMLCIARWF